ncbi:MAG: DedA family protein [Flavobacteriales bacterium]|nr:DedA family protein [Flavobacteriales bacterium]
MMDYVELGYFGLFIATFLAATIVPFSSEIVLAGMLAAGFDGFGVLAVATVGNTIGGMSSFYLGYLGKWRWIESKLRVPKEKVFRFKSWIDKYGSLTAFFCWLPFIGDVIAIALGVFRAKVALVLALMFLGKLMRYLLIVWGWLLV